MRSSTYAKQSRHAVVYARLVLPALRAGKRHEIQISTGTKDPREGVARARFLRVVLERLVAGPALPSPDHIIATLRAAMAQYRRPPPDAAKFDVSYDDAGKVVVSNVKPGEELSVASFMLAMEGRPNPSLANVAIAQQAPSNPVLEPSNLQHPGSLSAKARSPLRTMLNEYLGTLQEEVRIKRKTAKSYKATRSKLELFAEWAGDVLTGELTLGFINRYAEDLFYYPIRREILKVEPTLTLRDVIAAAKAGTLYYTNGAKAVLQAPDTVATYVVALRNFLLYCNEYGAVNPAVLVRSKLKAPPKADNTGTVREDFNNDELKRIFEDSYMREPRYNTAYQYWLPVIALFTGARLNEIAQLTTSDIIDMGSGIQALNITDTPEGNAAKSLKTRASRRVIPVHSKLIELGFLAYVDSVKKTYGGGNLFQLKAAEGDGYGKAPGPWFNDKYLPYLGIKAKGIVFHSFRHTFITRLNTAIVEHANLPKNTEETVANFPEGYVLRRLAGHSSRSPFTSQRAKADVHEATYMKNYSAEVTQRVLERLQFPMVEFTPYQPIGRGSKRRTMQPLQPRKSRAKARDAGEGIKAGVGELPKAGEGIGGVIDTTGLQGPAQPVHSYEISPEDFSKLF